jgi:hypothetical protein
MNDCCTVTDVEVPDAVMLPDDDTVVVFTVIVPGELWVVEPPPSIVVEVMLRTPDPTLRVTVAAEMVVSWRDVEPVKRFALFTDAPCSTTTRVSVSGVVVPDAFRIDPARTVVFVHVEPAT